jgi:hypothetical protein
MPDYHELMSLLSIPRPNGSAAEAATGRALRAWLASRDIPYRIHTFRLYPYFFEAIGLWLILSRTLLAVAIWLRWGWPALVIALVGLAGGALDWTLGMPLVTWPGARRGENLLVTLEPSAEEGASQEVVISAHYDSKTELLDHRRRAFFVRLLPLGMALTLLVGLLGLLDALLAASAPQWSNAAFVAGAALSLPVLFLAWGLGLNLALGRLVQPSTGAVDNGAACTVMAGLAERLARDGSLRRTKVTLALFTGEEANMQGSHAYVKSRAWPLPTAVVNLELLGQNGGYVLWERDGTGFRWLPTSPEVNTSLAAAVQEIAGETPQPAGPINSDGASFLARDIPTAVLGTRDQVLGLGGMHRPSDNLERIDMARLPEAVDILARFIRQVDETALPIPHHPASEH